MVDIVTSQIINNGARNLIQKWTNESDGTGETNVPKVFGPGVTIHLKVQRVIYDIRGGAVRLQWAGGENTDMLILAGFGTSDFTFFSGLVNPNFGGNATGGINFTTVGFVPGSSYSITMEMIKAI